MTDLHRVLTEATEHVGSPDLAGRALADAQRRRVRRAAAGALAAVVLVGGGVAWAVQERAPHADVVDTPVPSPTRVPTVLDPEDLDAVIDLPTPPPIDESLIQPLWDPATVGDLPAGDVGLPRSLDPPIDAPALGSVPAVVALVQDDDGLAVVDSSGAWWRTGLPEEPLTIGEWRTEPARLTTDGTWIAFAGRTALWARELAGDGWRRIDYPRGFIRARQFPGIVPQQGGHVILQRHREWVVDLGTGTMVDRPDPLRAMAWGDGVTVNVGGSSYGMRLVSWAADGATARTFRTDYLQALTGFAASRDSLAAVRGVGTYNIPRAPAERNGLVALDLDDLSTRAYLPLRDPAYAMTDGELMAAQGWLDDDTVLASVGQVSADLSTGTRTLFTWDVVTGGLRRVAALPAALAYDVAVGALAPVPEP